MKTNETMTKAEAMAAMKRGCAVSHAYFSGDEWVKQREDGQYEFEDGVTCSPSEFWRFRPEIGWETDWRIIKEPSV